MQTKSFKLYSSLVCAVALTFFTLFLSSCGGDDPAPDPVADFTYVVDEATGLKVTFTNTSQNAATYSWAFGVSGATSTVMSPEYTYTENGAYEVVLTATSADGSQSTKSKTVTIAVDGGEVINIAPNGAAYRWSKNTVSTSNTNRVAASGLNDNNTTVDVNLNGGVDDDANAYEAAGVIWESAPASITSFEFIQGSIDVDNNTCFTANLTLQFTTDGTTWTESDWTVSPIYPYTNGAAGLTYTCSGTAVTGKIGARISGQVRTNDNSWRAGIKEVLIYGME